MVAAACLAASLAYQHWAQGDALRKLYGFRAHGAPGDFLKALDTPYIRMHVTQARRDLMKLGYLIDQGDYQGAETCYGHAMVLKGLRPDDRLALQDRMLGYYLDRKKYDQAAGCIADLEKGLAGRHDPAAVNRLDEVRHLKAVYLDRDVSLIPDMEQMLGLVSIDETKAVIAYRLAKLYHFSDDDARARAYIKQASGLTSDGRSRAVLRTVLTDMKELD